MVSITFDDGPQRKYTSAVLDILRDKKVPATFFIIGNRVYHHEDILRRMIVEGHSIGNHSYTHTAFPKLTSEGVFREVFLTEKALFLTTGFMPRYFRFPYGEEDTRIKNVFFGQIIGWNVDAYDWKAKNPSVLTKQILSQLKPGCIILLHDIKPDTVAALPDIIEGIRKEGYTLVSLDTLLPKKKPQ